MDTSRIFESRADIPEDKSASAPRLRRRNVGVMLLIMVSSLPGFAQGLPGFAQIAQSVNADEGTKATGKTGGQDRDERAVEANSQSNAKKITPSSDKTTQSTSDQNPQSTIDTAQKDAGKDPVNNQPAVRKGEWLFAPIPISSPAIGSGLEWAVGYVFSFDKEDTKSPPSTVGVGGIITNNGTRGIAIGGRLYLKEDKYRVTAAIATATINADIFGVGKVSGDNGIFLPMTAKGSGFITEVLFRLARGIYLGPRVQWRNLSLELNRDEADIPDLDNPPARVKDIIDKLRDSLFRQKTVAMGPRFQWDTRDNTFYPTRGLFLDVGADFFGKGIGSKFTYQYYKVAFNKYASVGEKQVVGFRAMGCAAAGSRVPIYDLCLFGTNSDLRGYAAGRYQDRRMFATQGEYRLGIPAKGFLGRFGVVGFGGFGGVGGKFSDIGFSDFLPAGGGGIRFRLTKSNPINFRIDYAFGRVGNTLSIGVGEAF